jgi:rubrerythrin
MKSLILIVNLLFFTLLAYSQSKSTKTIKDLKEGIKGETTASAKYAAFAQKARTEKQYTIAKLFDAASKAESIHAANHTRTLNEMGEKMENVTPQFEVKTTAENLQSALEGETYEVVTMYPQFLRDATEENAPKAKKSFTWAFDTEKKHQQFYSRAITSLKSKTLNNLPAGYAVCPVCGNTFDKSKADERCSFCYTSRSRFINL